MLIECLAQRRPTTNGSCRHDHCNLFIPQSFLDLGELSGVGDLTQNVTRDKLVRGMQGNTVGLDGV